ncbi:hypothetical protein DV735_g3257, partial [Chaetothyriales sp. CBS 134920]
MGGGKVTGGPSTYPRLVERPVGQKIKKLYTDRLRQFLDNGQYREQGLRAKFYHDAADDDHHVKISVWSAPGLTRPTFKEATSPSNTYQNTGRGYVFGPSWSTHWFKIKLTVPTRLVDGEWLEFHWDVGCEGLVWSEGGDPLQGLTGGGERVEWVLPQSWRDGREHTFYIEVACNRMFGNAPGGDSIQPPDPNKYFQLSEARIVDVNLAARGLYIDFWIIGDAAREFPDDGWEKHKALDVTNRIMDAFIAGGGSNESILEGRRIAQEYIGENVNSAKVYDSDKENLVFGIGHCHIDTCWLWPWAETRRKVARSWSNQCNLIDRYPEHRFTCSQAQQYKWLKKDYPYVYDRVKQKVKEGTFQPVGGSWVEHDTNMPSGESLIRQFLYGQRFFQAHFGERCETFWLPDTFGYSAQLPQICRLSDMRFFFTQKLSWNNINNFPHTTFNWVSLDGSQVICHMAPSETYTAEAHFGDVKRSVTQHKSLDQDKTSLLVFGKGDGGGGPTWEMLEKLRRCRGISDTVGLLPRVKLGNSVDEFFHELEKKVAKGTELVTWYGELYFELHRGTYTTQAMNKFHNRKQEILLHDIEYLATLASLKSSSYKYPKKEIDEIWENVLLCQFHDCLPGSSIEMCYDDSDELYAHNYKVADKVKEGALSVLGLSEAIKPQAKLAAINTLPWPRSELVRLPSGTAESHRAKYAVVRAEGAGVAQIQEPALHSQATIEQVSKGVIVLKNRHFVVQVEGGNITSLYDIRADRQVLRGGKANQLVVFDDKPLYWQAWDVEVFHLESRQELQYGRSEILESGPYRVSVATKTQISDKSWVRTVISLDATDRDDVPSYVSVEAEVEWHETMKFLKVEFPVDVTSTEANYETQFGVVRRPTHYNTSWDMAKFEVCCHKFADLSEAGYGVSILNDSKYGFATCGNVMRLSLLRSPKAPDANADMKRHQIKWAILPHTGGLGVETVRAARNFNSPLQLVSLSEAASVKDDIFDAVTLTGTQSLVLDTVKRGEDDEDVSLGDLPARSGRSVIVRIYESLGGRSRGTIHTSLPVKKVWKTNALEDDLEAVEVLGKGRAQIDIELRAFEVATYRLQL